MYTRFNWLKRGSSGEFCEHDNELREISSISRKSLTARSIFEKIYLTFTGEYKLYVFENKVVGKIFGPKKAIPYIT
jgi:hypothetical protein